MIKNFILVLLFLFFYTQPSTSQELDPPLKDEKTEEEIDKEKIDKNKLKGKKVKKKIIIIEEDEEEKSPYEGRKAETFFVIKYNSFYYDEPGVMKEKGPMYGGYLNTIMPIGQTQAKFGGDFDYAFGKLRYIGGTWGGDSLEADANDSVYEARGIFGMGFNSDKLITYLGYGYRMLKDKIDGAGSYRRDISYNYIPIGALIRIDVNESSFFDINPELNVFLSGKAKSYLSDAHPLLPDVINEQTSGKGYKFNLNYVYNLSFGSILVRATYYRWEVEDSLPVFIPVLGGSVLEPKNNTSNYSLGIGLLF